MRKRLSMALGFASIGAILLGSPVENPLWLRNPSISPDGSTIAFTYRGNIYTVPAEGGRATQITQGSYNTAPLWSPDGSRIAFSSDREGSLDIYIVDAEGGTPQRLTTHSGTETPRAFLDDGHIIFSSKAMPAAKSVNGNFLGVTQVVSTTPGSRPRLFMSAPAGAVSVDGNRVLFQDKKGYEDPFRKHERSSGTADIWLVTLADSTDASKGEFRQLTTFNGHDLNPVWRRGTDEYFYLSEKDGTLNVYAASLDSDSKTQLTRFSGTPVRSLSASAAGDRLAFSHDGQLYTLTPGQEPRRVEVTVASDLYQAPVEKKTLTDEATYMAVSPDGKEIAFVAHGDVYVTSKDYATTKRVTNTPQQERVVDFSPDGRTLVYDSERDGMWQLFTATIANPDEDSFTYSTGITEQPLYKSDKPAFQPALSPDGKKVAFLEDRTTLKVIDLATKETVTVLDGKYNYSYSDGDVEFQWSPDSRWFLTSYIGDGGWNNMDIALVAADGSETHDLTNSGYSDGNAKWALKGKAVLWENDKHGYRSHGSWGAQSDIYIMFFDGEAFDRFQMSKEEVEAADRLKEKAKDKDDSGKPASKKKDKAKGDDGNDGKKKTVEPLKFDLANAPYRVLRLTGTSSNTGDFYIDDEGEHLYYGSDGDLWHRKIRDAKSEMIAKGKGRSAMVPSGDGEKLFLLSGSGAISVLEIPADDIESVEYKAQMDYKAAAEREYIFDHAWQQVKDKFYDENLHGVDWERYRDEYRKFLPHISNNYDFAEMLSEMLGELNASHTGAGYSPRSESHATAELGAFFDEDWDGDGLKVAETINMGPLSSKEADVKPGEIITTINGEPIKAGKDYYPLLSVGADEKIRLTVRDAAGKTRDVYIKPVFSVAPQLYRRWVERNRAVVDSLSQGRVGYVHVAGMDSRSFRNVYEEMLGRHRNCDAIIVDTRYNTGGWLHNDLAVLLSGKEYARFTPRGRYIGSEPFSQWHKPSVMLVNEANYSDGYGAPYAYQTLELGDIVGAPVPGTMTAVWWEPQIDPTLVFGIPQVTTATLDGQPLENRQLNPEVVIYNRPAEALNGHDAQLVGATMHLLEKLNTSTQE